MNKNIEKNKRKIRRAVRTRSNIFGSAIKPRLTVFRSLKHIRAQLIDDAAGKTMASADDKGLKGNKTDKAKEVGKLIATKAKDNKIESVIFDKGGNKYHGRVKALADAAREMGLKF